MRWLTCLLLCVAGCQESQRVEVRPNRAVAAIILSITYHAAAQPAPQPTPATGDCAACGGNGWYGDVSNVCQWCQACGGDGWTSKQLERVKLPTPDGRPRGSMAKKPAKSPEVKPIEERKPTELPEEKPKRNPKSLLPERIAWSASFAEAQREAKRLDRPCLVHFTTDACPPCEAWRRLCEDSGPVSHAVNECIPVLVYVPRTEIDAQRGEAFSVAKDYGVREFPTQVILAADWSRVLGRYTPSSDEAKYLEQLEAATEAATGEK